MKKYIVIALLAVVAMANAQVSVRMLSSNGYYNDTLTNGETNYYYVPAIGTLDNVLTLSINATNLTGTTAGTVILQENISTTLGASGQWVAVNQSNTTSLICRGSAAGNDTLTVINGSVGVWELQTTPGKQYRLKNVQTGSSTTKYDAYYLIKPKKL